MSEKQPSWIEQHCSRLVSIERMTIEKLGEERAGTFVLAADDCMTLGFAAAEALPDRKCGDLVLLTLWGLFKEAYWFHSYFVAGNYPLLLGRLRFVWESMFRAYFAEHYPMGSKKWDTPGPTVDDKVAWLDRYGKDLRWDTCIEPVLGAVFPLADQNQEVRDHYKGLFQYLHRYAHPSAYLMGRIVGDSALMIRDAFDEQLALETAEIGAKVFDLIWMVVLAQHPSAFDRVGSLSGQYPMMAMALVVSQHRCTASQAAEQPAVAPEADSSRDGPISQRLLRLWRPVQRCWDTTTLLQSGQNVVTETRKETLLTGGPLECSFSLGKASLG
jgi:hypothetical protein